MSEVESATKIRAKYLRALENEEWGLLPGPTFVKTFLRTYAEYLGLDARTLVEEYKQRYERPSSGELTPFAPVAARGIGRHRRRRPLGPWLALPVVVLAVLAALWLLGRDDAPTGNAEETTGPSPTATEGSGEASQAVRLSITARRSVRICLIDSRGREVLGGRRLAAGRRTSTYSGRRFRVGFDGGTARLRVGDRSYAVDARSRPSGFDLRAGERPRRLAGRRVPRCR
jgi:hypothetical protein